MARTCAGRWLGLLALFAALAGCYGPHRMDGSGRRLTRDRDAVAQTKGPHAPTAPLHISSPPTARATAGNDGIKQATFVPVPKAPDAPPAAPPAPASSQPTPERPAGNPLRELHQKAEAHWATVDSYIMRMRRREVVGGQSRPEEVMLVKFRKEPWSVYFKWLGPEAKGREVVYVKGKHKGNIHTLTAAGDIPLFGAGHRFEVSPDSALVRSKSRYPITDAGLESLIRRYGRLIDAVEKGDPRQGTARYLGRLKRPEFEQPVEGVLQNVPPQSDPLLPKGGQRWWYFDTAVYIPLLVITQDDASREVEYYCHEHFQSPVRLDDDDFSPDKLWKKSP